MMSQYNLRRAIGAGVLMGFAFSASIATSYAQFVTVIEGDGQKQVNPVNEPATGAQPLQTLTAPFVGAANGESLSGNIVSAVYANSLGGLDFFYQVEVTATTGGITATNLTDFTGFSTASAFRVDSDIDGPGAFTAGGKRPFGSQRVSGGIVAFAFNSNPLASGGNSPGVLLTGDRSSLLVVRTDATNFRVSNGTINGGAAANAAILAPAVGVFVVPEPGTFALLLPGAALSAVLIKRRRKSG